MSKYPETSIAVDLIIIRPPEKFILDRDNQCINGPDILFIERKNDPFKGCLALPGGFVDRHETVEEAACRELEEETGVILMEDQIGLLKISSDPYRDPRGRVISIAFRAEVPPETKARAGDYAKSVIWLSRDEAMERDFAFDHKDIFKFLCDKSDEAVRAFYGNTRRSEFKLEEDI